MTRNRTMVGFLVMVLWFPAVVGAMEGQKPLFQRQTPHFTIVYPAEAETEASRLQALAEGVFDEVSSLVAAPAGFHLPVVINPGTDQLNGYFTAYPSARIVLDVAPISPDHGFAVYDDVLRRLFLHELTHAVSLLQKDGFSAFFSALMGDVVSPALMQAPGNFIEGITVAAESRGGFGRAHDPDEAAVLQQALLEDRFPTFLETTGAGDRYPWGLWYTYGGWFSRWLLETEGSQKYADLWAHLGSNRGIYDWLWFSGAFRSVYGTSIDEAWGRFGDWMRLKVEVLAPGPFLDRGYGRIRALAVRDHRVWVARDDGAFRIDLAADGSAGPLVREFALDSTVVRLDPGAGGRILVSRSRQTPYGGAAWSLEVWDTSTRSFEVPGWPDHLGEAAWLADGEGIVAVRPRGYTLDLVRVIGDRVEVLVTGTSAAIPSQPCPQGDGSLLFLLQVKGENLLARWEAGRVTVLRAPGLGHVRHLSSDGDRAWFTWDADLTLPKLGSLRGADLRLYPTVSGGVHRPAGEGDTVVYRADFTQGERLVGAVVGTPTTVQGTWSEFQAPEEPVADAAEGAPYNPLGASLVPGFRYPLVKLDLGGGRPIRGGGVGFQSSDPAGYFSWTGSAQWLPVEGYLDTGLSLALGSLPLDLSLAVADTLKPRAGAEGEDVREASALVNLGKVIFLDRATQVAFAALQTGVADRAPSDGTDRAYGWAWQRPFLSLAVNLGYQDLWSDSLNRTRSGWSIAVATNGAIDPAVGPRPLGAGQVRADLWFPWLKGHLAPRLVVPTGAGQTLVPGGVVNPAGDAWSRNDLWRVPSFFEGRTDLRGQALAGLEGDVGVRVPVGWALGKAFYFPALEFQVGWQNLGVLPTWGQAPGEWLTSVNALGTLVWEFTQVPLFDTMAVSVGARLDQPLGGAAEPGPVVSPWFQMGSLY